MSEAAEKEASLGLISEAYRTKCVSALEASAQADASFSPALIHALYLNTRTKCVSGQSSSRQVDSLFPTR